MTKVIYWLKAVVLALSVALSPAALFGQTPDAPRTYERVSTPKAPVGKSEIRLEVEAAMFSERERACESGSVAACSDLGEAYELGIGTPQNRPIAAILYAEACDAADPTACYRLGRLTRVATEPDAKEASSAAFERACDLGSLDGCARLASAYRLGEGTEKDEQRGIDLAYATCERGGATACRDYALSVKDSDPEGQRSEEVAAILHRACVAGEVRACLDLISLDRDSENPARQARKAELLRYACEADDADSCERLGDLLLDGNGPNRDVAAALARYDRACYLSPELFCQRAQDLRSEPLDSQACQNDDFSACARLGRLYGESNTPFYNPELSQDYYEFACYAGAAEACPRAGALLLDRARELDPATITQGIAYLERGCAADQFYACSQLAEYAKLGEFVPQDMERYYELLARMCDANWGRSCEDLEMASQTDQRAPIIPAGARYIPPIEPGDTDWMEPYLSDEERKSLANSCATSEIEFRGQLYVDTVCVPRELVIGGKALRPGAAPWQALLWRPERAFGRNLSGRQRVLCGGSLIKRGWILTAAHCLRDDGNWITRGGYTVRLGVYNPREDEGVKYPITRIYRHPDYNPSTFAFDIALVRYDANAGQSGAATNAIRSISIDRESVQKRVIRRGQPAHIYGWGWTAATNSGSTAELRGARLLLESQARCNGITGFPRQQWNTMLCAAGANNEQACKGDSGGPLITYNDADRRPRVIGVISSGRSCGQGPTREASRYVRVAYALEWIDQVMNRRR